MLYIGIHFNRRLSEYIKPLQCKEPYSDGSELCSWSCSFFPSLIEKQGVWSNRLSGCFLAFRLFFIRMFMGIRLLYYQAQLYIRLTLQRPYSGQSCIPVAPVIPGYCTDQPVCFLICFLLCRGCRVLFFYFFYCELFFLLHSVIASIRYPCLYGALGVSGLCC